MSLYDDLTAVCAAQDAGSTLCVDTETDGAPVQVAKLRLVAVSDGAHAAVFSDPLGAHRQALLALFRRPGTWVAHNAQFDRRVLENNLGACPDLIDTYTAAHLIDSRPRGIGGPGLSLADLAEFYLGETKQHDDLKAEFKRGGWTWATIPTDNPVYVRYAAQDAKLTARLWNERLATDDRLLFFEMDVARVVAGMEDRGVRVDPERAAELGVYYRTKADEAVRRGAEEGCRNIFSPAQVKACLGTDGASKEVLETLDAPLARIVLDGRHARKMASTYADAFLRDSARDGRLHPSINPLGARTGRMSSSRPNLQNVPKERIRECLVADPGNVIWAADFKGVEVRVLAALSQDQRLIEAIRGGRSLHDDTALAIFGPGYTEEQRGLAKAGVFAVLYGSGVGKLQRTLGVDLPTAKAIHGGLFKAYPAVGRFARRTAAMAEQRGYVETRSGRRLRVERDRAYAGTNFVIQGTAAELFKVSLLQVVDAGLSEYLLVPVHDELVGQAPEAEATEVLAAVVAAMATELDGVPIEANGKVGRRSWGSLYGADE